MRRAAALLLLAILLAGCGQQNAGKAMDEKFAALDFQIGSRETIAAPSDPSLRRLTRQYVALVREYAPVLGRAEARRRLVDKGDELSAFCLACAGTLYDAARTY